MEGSEKLLVVICDINPKHWSKVNNKMQTSDSSSSTAFEKCMESLLVFCNSYLMFNHTNKLAFIACHSTSCTFVYPPKNNAQTEDGGVEERSLMDGKFEAFVEFNNIVTKGIKELLSVNELSHTDAETSLLTGAFTKALCYIHNNSMSSIGQPRESRIFILTPSPDASSQYMPTMNCIFASQKKNIIVDACSVHQLSGFLQQAADITNGIYSHIEDVSGLLEYLLFKYLPDADIRKKLELPASVEIDYRAACFCHKQLVDVGFVCSVCLSIYCQLMPKCMTCQTRFKLPNLAALKAKKKKK